MSHTDTIAPEPSIHVEVLLRPHGRLTALALELGCPLATVSSWKQKGAIPPWRRPAVLDAVRRMKLDLPDEVIAYLVRA